MWSRCLVVLTVLEAYSTHTPRLTPPHPSTHTRVSSLHTPPHTPASHPSTPLQVPLGGGGLRGLRPHGGRGRRAVPRRRRADVHPRDAAALPLLLAGKPPHPSDGPDRQIHQIHQIRLIRLSVPLTLQGDVVLLTRGGAIPGGDDSIEALVLDYSSRWLR